MCSDTKKSESIGDTHKTQIPIQENGDGQVISYYTMKEKTLRINNFDKLTDVRHRSLLMNRWRILRTSVQNNDEEYLSYKIWVEGSLVGNVPDVIEITINSKIEGGQLLLPYVNVELEHIKRDFSNPSNLKEIHNTTMTIESMEDLQTFKKALENVIFKITDDEVPF